MAEHLGARMKRRRLLGSAALALAPGGALAQAARPRRIAWISEAPHPFLAAFREGLVSAGLVEQNDFVIATHYGDGTPARLDEVARELGAGAADIVVATGGVAVDAARRHVSAVPLFIVTNNTVGLGLVESLARPGANVSGFDLATDEFAPKWLELLVQLLPASRRIGVLMGESRETASQFAAIAAAAPTLGREVFTVGASDGNFARAFAELAASGAQGAISVSFPPFAARRHALIVAAAASRIPVCYLNRVYTQDGGLMSYGPDFAAAFRRVGQLVARIVRGARSDQIPVERPTRYELVINLVTARALGLEVPPLLLARADDMIE
ncbi:MAG: hypothetical protein FJX57_15335 [Alphaproteobacteria bacterium]|nr:hypothetical protein [Alphaproteobacteria bacterium]